MGAEETWIIVPAYNERTIISTPVRELKRLGYQVVVVNDGSSDDTARIAVQAGAVVLTHVLNLGQGAALQTGIEFALSQGANFVVTFDADGQHRAQDVPKLMHALEDTGAQFALGSRFLGSAPGVPKIRKALLRAATWFTRAATGLRITDTHNGLRAMTRRGAAMVTLRQNRMAHASEIMHQIAASGLKYVEVPVTVEYTQYSLSKGQRVREMLAIVVDLVIRRLHR